MKFHRIWIGLIFVIAWSTYASAQVEKKSESQRKAEELKLQKEILKNKELETKLLEQAFEKAIDSNTYIVGPGDYFSVVIWGDIQESFQLPVTPEGFLPVPTIGNVKVNGLTLRQAESVVEEAALRKYKDVPVTINLMMMRKIRVHVTGEVLNPGTFVATPLDRLSDLIFRAGNLKEFADAQFVRVQHLDGSSETINFSAFLKFGDLAQNPFVREGDVIFIPTMDLSKPVVRVSGMVDREGLYPLFPGETVQQFLQRNGILARNQELRAVQLIRDGKAAAVLNLTREADLHTPLRNGDVLHLPIDQPQIYVIGAVLKAGAYPYYENYTAADYIGIAGATENGTGLSGARVHHRDTGKTEKASKATLHPGDMIEIPLRTSRRWAEYLQIASQLATIVIAYYATRR